MKLVTKSFKNLRTLAEERLRQVNGTFIFNGKKVHCERIEFCPNRNGIGAIAVPQHCWTCRSARIEVNNA